jgi:transcriptional regulator with XRE-family HTH domain
VKDLRSAFGARLRDLRRGAALTQEELAHRARIASGYLSDLERGQQSPTLDVVNRLARALGVTMSEMFMPLTERYRSQFRKRRSDSAET